MAFFRFGFLVVWQFTGASAYYVVSAATVLSGPIGLTLGVRRSRIAERWTTCGPLPPTAPIASRTGRSTSDIVWSIEGTDPR